MERSKLLCPVISGISSEPVGEVRRSWPHLTQVGGPSEILRYSDHMGTNVTSQVSGRLLVEDCCREERLQYSKLV